MVVICHNNRAEIDRCLERVLDLGCSVTLVDTASTDGSAAHVRAHYPTVHLVELTENRGFGSAANDGVESAGTRYVLLLNADAWPEPGATESLVEAADRAPSVGAIGPRLIYVDGSDQRSVFGSPQSPAALAALVAFPRLVDRLYPLVQRFRRRKERGDAGGARAAVIVPSSEFVSGAALLLRKEAFAARRRLRPQVLHVLRGDRSVPSAFVILAGRSRSTLERPSPTSAARQRARSPSGCTES